MKNLPILASLFLCLLPQYVGASEAVSTSNRPARASHKSLESFLKKHVAPKDLQSLDIATLNDRGHYLLHSAAANGDLPLVKFLLDGGMDVHFRLPKVEEAPIEGFMALHLAALNGHLEVCKELIGRKAQASKSMATLFGYKEQFLPHPKASWTPLHLAAEFDHDELCTLLLDCGANCNTEGVNGCTPLHLAARNNSLRSCRSLLSRNDIALEVQTKDACTPLHLAARLGHSDACTLLLDRGAKIDAQAVRKVTALHLAAQSNRQAVVSLLLERGASIDAKDADSYTPLHLAIMKGHIEVCRVLLKAGASVTQIIHGDITALYLAAYYVQKEICGLLLEYGAQVDTLSQDGWSPLHVAVYYGSRDVCTVLLEGRLVSKENLLVAVQMAMQANDEELCKLLLNLFLKKDSHADRLWSPLHLAAYYGWKDVCSFLIERRCEINQLDSANRTAWSLAAQQEHKEVCSLLLAKGAKIGMRDIYTKVAEDSLLVACELASKRGKEIAVRLLRMYAQKVADGHAEWTDLHRAAYYNCPGICLLLLGDGILDVQDSDGCTALHLATKKNHQGIVALLTHAGADRTSKSNDENIPDAQVSGSSTRSGVTASVSSPTAKDATDQLQAAKEEPVSGGATNDDLKVLSAAVAVPHDRTTNRSTQPSVVSYDDDNEQHLREKTSADSEEEACTSLYEAVRLGDTTLITQLLDADRGLVNKMTEKFGTPLHVAVQLCKTKDGQEVAGAARERAKKVCRVLIDKGVVSKVNWLRALEIAVENVDREVCELVLGSYAKKDRRAPVCKEPLYVAIHYGHTAICSFLIGQGTNVQQEDDDGRTPLHYAAERGNKDVCKLLLDQGAKFDAQDKNGRLALHDAAFSGREDLCDLLIEKSIGTPGFTADILYGAIEIAAQNNHKKLALSLLRVYTQMEGDQKEWTDLHRAAHHGFLRTSLLLLGDGILDVCDSNGCTALHLAAKRNFKEIVTQLIAAGAQKDIQNTERNTPLCVALMAESFGTAEILISLNADILLKTLDERTALHIAVDKGHEDIVMKLLERNPPINICDKHGFTPMTIAAQNNNAVLVNRLALKHAHVGPAEGHTWTPLHGAANNGHAAMVATLIDQHQAKVNAVAKVDGTPLHLAAGANAPDVCEALLMRKADTEIRAKNGWTPLHVAAYKGNLLTIAKLLEHNADINARAADGKTPLHVAACYNNKQACAYFITKGADFTVQDTGGITALECLAACETSYKIEAKTLLQSAQSPTIGAFHIAAAIQDKNLCAAFILRGVQINSVGLNRWTALHIAAHFGNKDSCELLIAKGAKLDSLDVLGGTPLLLAMKKGYVDTSVLLFSKGCRISNSDGGTVLHLEGVQENGQLFEALIGAGAPVDAQRNDGKTPLHLAAYNNKKEACQILLDKKASVVIQDTTQWTALHCAAYKGVTEIGDLLLKRGAAVDAQGDNLWTSLHLCAQEGHCDFARLLIGYKCSMNMRDIRSWTPLHIASHHQNKNVVDLLIENDADASLTIPDGRKAADIAKSKGNLETVKVLNLHANTQDWLKS